MSTAPLVWLTEEQYQRTAALSNSDHHHPHHRDEDPVSALIVQAAAKVHAANCRAIRAAEENPSVFLPVAAPVPVAVPVSQPISVSSDHSLKQSTTPKRKGSTTPTPPPKKAKKASKPAAKKAPPKLPEPEPEPELDIEGRREEMEMEVEEIHGRGLPFDVETKAMELLGSGSVDMHDLGNEEFLKLYKLVVFGIDPKKAAPIEESEESSSESSSDDDAASFEQWSTFLAKTVGAEAQYKTIRTKRTAFANAANEVSREVYPFFSQFFFFFAKFHKMTPKKYRN